MCIYIWYNDFIGYEMKILIKMKEYLLFLYILYMYYVKKDEYII